MPKKERRQVERFAPAFRVRTEVLQEEGSIHMAVFADIVNISEGGICFRSPLKLSPRDKVIFFLPRLDHHLPLEVHGQTIWTKALTPVLHEYGMQFTGLDAEGENRLRAELNAIMRSYFDQSVLRLE